MEGINKDKLFVDAYEGKIADLIKILDKDISLLTNCDSNERLLIHWAALGGHTELVQHLLSLGSPVDPLDDTHMTPLILASSAGKNTVVRLLISAGANVNSQNVQGHSSLQYASSKGWIDGVKILLEEGAEVNIADIYGARPLHRASSIGHLPVVRLLLSHIKIDINPRDSEGNTPLHLSCEEDRGEVAMLLVERGAKLDAVNKNKKTPLELAPRGLANMLKSLISQG